MVGKLGSRNRRNLESSEATVHEAAAKEAEHQPTVIEDYPQFLYDTGLLFEFNRTILHPLGYHLLAIATEGKVHSLRLKHCSDPRGWWFMKKEFEKESEKLEAFAKEIKADEKANTRVRLIDVYVQCIDSILPPEK